MEMCDICFIWRMHNLAAVHSGASWLSMSGVTALAKGSRRLNERERWVANAVRLESIQLCRRLHFLGLQHQRELARVRGAQLELRQALDRLRGHGPSSHPSLARPVATSTDLTPVRTRGQMVVQSCCPNHIVCSSCNLRLRLADTLTRRFTPGLWTMYCQPLPTACLGDSQYGVYRMPSFVERRNLSTLDKSLRYLPFV